jgi:hypothetical protein
MYDYAASISKGRFMMAGVLYISYDGMLEPLGQSQVLSYLRHLAVDREIHLISFEKADDWGNTSARENLARAQDFTIDIATDRYLELLFPTAVVGRAV